MQGKAVVTLKCTVDQRDIIVDHDALSGSRLVASLPQDEGLSTLAMPFTSNAVQAWQAVMNGGHEILPFVGYMDALKVSDFLADDRTAAAAAAEVNQYLFPDAKLPVKADFAYEESLKTLPPHVISAVFRSWSAREPEVNDLKSADILRCMLETLSSQFHPLVVASCTSNASLNIDWPLDEEHVAAIAAAVPDLAHELSESEKQYWLILANMCPKVVKEQKPQFCKSRWPVASDAGNWDTLPFEWYLRT